MKSKVTSVSNIYRYAVVIEIIMNYEMIVNLASYNITNSVVFFFNFKLHI